MRILYIEPYHGGSHKAFGETLMTGVDAQWTALTLPARHWKWRMRGIVPWLALEKMDILERPYDLLFVSSYVPLAELKGLAPSLAPVPSILYFHENQLTYPLRAETKRTRDMHFGFTQLVSALAADRVLFNSAHNRDSFLGAAEILLAKMPDAVPRGWPERIGQRATVMPIPMNLPELDPAALRDEPDSRALGPIILWNHRWEYDKRPDRFFGALKALHDQDVAFRVAVAGQRFQQAPKAFEHARPWLEERIVHWGYAHSRADYESLLGRCHVAVSTADHEFFGMAMVEAAHFGAYPLVPDALAYPEIFPPECRYTGDDALVARLKHLCESWCEGATLRDDRQALTAPFGDRLLARYTALFHEITEASHPLADDVKVAP